MVYELHNTFDDLEELSAFVSNNEHLLPDPLSQHVGIQSYCRKLLRLGRVFTFKEDSMVLGICMGYINDLSSFVSHLQVLLVATSDQHKGIGWELVSLFVLESRKAGMKTVMLTCDVTNHSAMSFYKHFGFVETPTPHPNPEKAFLILSL